MPRLALALVAAGVLGLGAAPAGAQPTWWLTVGGHAALETGDLTHVLGTEGAALVGGGWHLVHVAPFLLGVDAEVTAGRVSANLGTLEDEKITVYRGRLGVRFTFWMEDDEPRLVPYGRVGLVYRTDRGDFIKDDGFGVYVGLGLDFRISDSWSIGPFVMYEFVSLSVNTETVLVGFGLTFSH